MISTSTAAVMMFSHMLCSTPFLSGFVGLFCLGVGMDAQDRHDSNDGDHGNETCREACPIVTTADENLMFICKGFSLQTRLAEFRAAGNEYHPGYMYSPLEEAVEFGKYKHEL